MIKKINKKIAFKASVIVSSLAGLLFTGSRGITSHSVDAVLQAPIFSVEKVSATDGGGDCCCGCSGCDVYDPPTPTSAGVNIHFTSP
jgi:hypothetical protein